MSSDPQLATGGEAKRYDELIDEYREEERSTGIDRSAEIGSLLFKVNSETRIKKTGSDLEKVRNKKRSQIMLASDVM